MAHEPRSGGITLHRVMYFAPAKRRTPTPALLPLCSPPSRRASDDSPTAA